MRPLLSRVSVLVLWLLAGVALPGVRAVAQERPEVGKYARVYKGGEGVTVVVVRVGPLARNEALVQINGIDNPLDGKIRLHEVVNQGAGKYDYQTRSDGSLYNTLVMRNGLVELYAKGLREAVQMTYSEELSREVQPEHVLTAYLEQQKSGRKE